MSQTEEKHPLIEWAIGKNIVCDDGVTRRCVEMVNSYQYPFKMVINENDPDSKLGHFVHVASLANQMHGLRLPTEAEKKRFEKSLTPGSALMDKKKNKLHVVKN